MAFEELDEKYLDPNHNPMLPGSTAPPFEKKPEEPSKYTDPAFNKMIDASMADVSPDPGILTARIAAAFPGQNEAEVAGETIVLMADGAYTIAGKPLSQVSPEVLLRISAAIR